MIIQIHFFRQYTICFKVTVKHDLCLCKCILIGFSEDICHNVKDEIETSNFCYFRISLNSSLSWYKARSECLARKMDLVTLMDTNDKSLFVDFLQMVGINSTFIGVTRNSPEFTFDKRMLKPKHELLLTWGKVFY